MPLRARLAIVMSLAAIAGCGQSAEPSQAGAPDLASGPAGGAPSVAAAASADPRDEEDGRAGAAADGREQATPGHASERARDTATPGPAGATAERDPPPDQPSGRSEAMPDASEAPRDPSTSSPSSEIGPDPEEHEHADLALDELDPYERPVFTLLATTRDGTGAEQLHVDADLVAAARERACTMARGATPLLAEDHTENIGLVVEPEPDVAAAAMHDWWMRSSDTRRIRLTAGFTRYGVGACLADDRVYYSERFGS